MGPPNTNKSRLMPQDEIDLQSVQGRQTYINQRLMELAKELDSIDMKESSLQEMKEQAMQSSSGFRPHQILDERYQQLKRLAVSERDPHPTKVQAESDLSAMKEIMRARIANRTQAYWDAYKGMEEERPSEG